MSAYDPTAWERNPAAFGGEGGWAEPYRANLVAWVLAAAPSSVLDLGCLDGALGRELRRHRYTGAYRGVDVTPAFIDRARRLSPHDVFCVADVRTPVIGLTGDVVVLANVIMHLDRPWDALAAACEHAVDRVVVSTYSADPALDEPSHGFLNHWFTPTEVKAHVPAGWTVAREALIRPTWTADPRKGIFQLEARRC